MPSHPEAGDALGRGRDSPLVTLLRQPDRASVFSGWQWTRTLAQARAERLAGPLAIRLSQAGVSETLDRAIQRHQLADRRVAERRERILRWETGHIAEALKQVDTRIALLKGAAYVLAALPNGQGRTSSDVDILVPRAALAAVEEALLAKGWRHLKVDLYDQRYYRAYMHELPPLLHEQRGTVLDVHHNIAPQTSRLRVPESFLWQGAEPIPGSPFFRLRPAILTLHAAIHLFHDGEITGGFRDLVDIDGLFRYFSNEPGYWQSLLDCAGQPTLGRPLFYAQRYARQWLETPIPTDFGHRIGAHGPPKPLLRLMDALIEAAFAPAALDTGHKAGDLARWLLYMRSHWLRMPLTMLSYHLAHKAVYRLRDRLRHRRTIGPGLRPQ